MSAGKKRKNGEMDGEAATADETKSPLIPIFEGFRAELDEHHDRRERIIKVSRDVTAQSKKIIFALQRTRDLGRPIHASITKTTTPMYNTIRDLLASIVPDLQGINTYRYRQNITGGIQEYMEAVIFQHYLEQQQIMTFDQAASSLPQGIMLTYEDYILGLFDMTGELMRFAITYMATNGKLPTKPDHTDSSSILTDMQDLRAALEAVEISGHRGLAKDYDQKLKVTRQSVEKVENGVYQMIVRGKERPPGWRPDAEGRAEGEAIESY